MPQCYIIRTLIIWFGPILMKFSTRDVHRNLMSDSVFHKNWYSESSTLLTWINIQSGSNMTGTDLCVNKPHMSQSYLNHLVFQSVFSTFIGLDKIQYERSAHTVLLNIFQLPENWHREGHTYRCMLNYVTAYTVKPYDILKVKNGLVNLCTTSWSILFCKPLTSERELQEERTEMLQNRRGCKKRINL